MKKRKRKKDKNMKEYSIKLRLTATEAEHCQLHPYHWNHWRLNRHRQQRIRHRPKQLPVRMTV